jgi:hypothetical protein
MREELTKKKAEAEVKLAEAEAGLQDLKNICGHPSVPQRSQSRNIEPLTCADCNSQVFLSVAGRA